ncbi:MAG: hypothetical protein AMS18_02750 [Gemmatimonas sp. SG8_17]|nr:MAG: hypothetical protein AMS18_02750 [Gemmatimonas sp. SG8_17]
MSLRGIGRVSTTGTATQRTRAVGGARSRGAHSHATARCLAGRPRAGTRDNPIRINCREPAGQARGARGPCNASGDSGRRFHGGSIPVFPLFIPRAAHPSALQRQTDWRLRG